MTCVDSSNRISRKRAVNNGAVLSPERRSLLWAWPCQGGFPILRLPVLSVSRAATEKFTLTCLRQARCVLPVIP